jgi:gliding motility-associated-like protein
VRLFLTWTVVCVWLIAGAQEICDNGVDDSGNGLVDLNDPACACEGIFVRQDVTAWIPNPSFEQFGCCPTFYDQFGCATGWQNGTNGTPDLHHTCGFVSDPILAAGLVPFPDGGGIGAIIFSSTWKEYMAVCLAQPLQAGLEYALRFHIASVPITGAGNICNNGVVYYSPIEVVIYGRADCGGLPLPTLECPSAVDPAWTVIGSAVYAPASSWSEMEIILNPGVNISSIMIGAPCSVPPSYASAQPCFPYFLFDGLTLEESAPAPPITIEVSGHPCQGDLTLGAWAPLSGGEWQWYYNGVAILGQTTPTLEIPESDYQPGVYTVRYTVGDDCDLAEVVLTWTLPEPTIEEVLFCPGDTIFCAGQAIWEEGYQEIVLASWQGCDSVIACIALYHPASTPFDTLTIRRCGVDTLFTCDGDTITQSGIYTFICEDVYGCRSQIYADIALLKPTADISVLVGLGCDTSQAALLQVMPASVNLHPQGTTHFQWTGPPGGLQSDPTDSLLHAVLPGEYCLVLTHIVDSFSCADTACVTLLQDTTLPDPPDISGPSEVCVSDSVTVVVHKSVADSLATVYWYADAGLELWLSSDSTWTLRATQAGTYIFCSYLLNQCGRSDTVCQALTFLPVDVSLMTVFVCDTLAAGVDTVYLQNQFGCDSVAITERIFSGIYEEVQEVWHCEAGVAYADTLVLSSGPCDSLFITHHHYHPPDTLYMLEYTCDAASAGEWTAVFTGTSGCDSVVITAVLLLPKDTTHLTSFTCEQAEALEETLLLTNTYGCDSIVFVEVRYMGIDTQYVMRNTCDSAQVGEYIYHLPGLHCDTVFVEQVGWAPYTMTTELVISCDTGGPAADTLIFSNAAGCDSMHIRQYQYNDLEAILAVTAESCAGRSDGRVEILQVTGGELPYTYRLNQGAWEDTSLFDQLAPGTYRVTIRDAHGCTRIYEALSVGEGTVMLLSAGPDLEVERGAWVPLLAQASSELQDILWTALDPIACPGCVATQLGPVTASQTVRLTAFNAAGCRGEDHFEITLRSTAFPKVYIPTSFSPNFDGINDLFTIYGSEEVRRVRSLSIYDRWGNHVFYREDLPINEPGAGWDGMYGGRLMDPAVFVYTAEIEFVDGTTRLYKGELKLVR